MQQASPPNPLLNPLDHDPKPQHLHAGHHRSKRGRGKLWLIVAGVCVLALLAAAVIIFLNKGKAPSAQSAAPVATEEEASNEQPRLSPAEAAKPVTFKSEKLNIELTHRADWTLTESADKLNLVLTSPKTNESGTSEVFTVRIGKGIGAPALKTLNTMVAVKDSIIVGYAAPTEAQRHYTNVSFAGDASQFHFFIVTGSTALKSGQRLEDTVSIGKEAFLIVGGYGDDAQNELAFTPLDPANFESLATYQQAIKIIESLKIY